METPYFHLFIFLKAALAPFAASVLLLFCLFRVYSTSALLLETNILSCGDFRGFDEVEQVSGGFKLKLSTFLVNFSDSKAALVLNKLSTHFCLELITKSLGALFGNAINHTLDLNFSNIRYPEFLVSLNSKS